MILFRASKDTLDIPNANVQSNLSIKAAQGTKKLQSL